MLIRTALLLLLAAILAGCASTDPRGPYRHGVVAADHETASKAGLEILRAGGNAVDAAVATSFTLSVVRPYSCGIGGGGFMVIHLPNDPTHGPVHTAINYRETAPAAVGPDFYETLPPGASTRGGAAVAIPGTVAGLLHALDRYGALDRAQVLAPAIRAAEEGFTVDAHYLQSARELIDWFLIDPARRERFAFVWERFLRRGEVQEGDLIRLPEQAAALRLIAEHGAAAFYDGPIGAAAAAAIHRDGGPMTQADLRTFVVTQSDPLRFTFANRTLLTMPPPSSGGIALAQTLGILERIRPPAASPDDPPHVHAFAESFKHAFADRAEWLADPAFVDVPVARLLSDDYLDERAATFDPQRTLAPEAYGTRRADLVGAAADGGTSHFSVVDRHGGAVACTETINLVFGSLVAVPEYGFVLNNEMDDFTTRRGRANAFGLRQSDANLPAPGKRPLSSMTPTIVLDERGRVVATAGASGGPRIITGTTQALANVLLFDLPAYEAVAAPRFHHQWSPHVLLLEHEADATLAEALTGRGHRVERTGAVGNVQLIRRTRDGRWDAASDPRKGGRPAGY